MTENEYLEELKDIVGFYNGHEEYDDIFRELHKIEFYAIYELDEPRVSDVYAFLRVPYGYLEDELRVSFLEMLVAFFMRVSTSIIGDGDIERWFWLTIENFGFLKNGFDKEKVVSFIGKKCGKTGINSPWPLKSGIIDAEKIDFWRHFCLYFSENFV